MMLDTTLSILPTLIQWDTQVFLAVNGCHHPFFDSFMEMYSDRFFWLPLYLSIAFAVYRQFQWKAAVLFLLLALLLLTVNDQLCSSVFRSAFARMRPSKSVMDMEVSSLKKKYKDKKFAAGCSRDVIQTGAERLGWTLEELMEKTILAMRSCEAQVNEELASIT